MSIAHTGTGHDASRYGASTCESMPAVSKPLPIAQWRAALRAARKRRRLSQHAVAALAGVQDAAISDWETGKNVPTLVSVDRLRTALPDLPPLEGVIDREQTGAPRGGPTLRRPEDIADRPAWARDMLLSRLGAGLTLAEVARRSGIDIPTLSQYENAHRRPGPLNERRVLDAIAGIER